MSIDPEPKISSSALRMRRTRERRRNGIAGCIIVEIKQAEIDELVRRGLVLEEKRRDYEAVLGGLHHHLDLTLRRVR